MNQSIWPKGRISITKKMTSLERLYFYCMPEPNTGCWIWHGTKATDDYGRFYFRGMDWPAYRVSYTLLVGEIPDGYEVDHLCRNRHCINPQHLEAVTRNENIKRQHKAKTHCRQGHPYSPENTRLNIFKHRVCITCAKASDIKSRNKKLMATK